MGENNRVVKHPKLTYRLQLDEPLWHLSRYGCKFRKGNFCEKRKACPIGEFCVRGIVNVSAERVEVNTGEVSGKASLSNFMLGEEK